MVNFAGHTKGVMDKRRPFEVTSEVVLRHPLLRPSSDGTVFKLLASRQEFPTGNEFVILTMKKKCTI